MTLAPGSGQGPPKGPPPLTPFGLKLHHDGVFSHEGEPIGNRRLREHFDRSVEYLADKEKFIVRLKHFRGEIVVQEAGFFVRAVDLDSGEIHLSDGTREALDLSTLAESPIDGALLCRVKRDLVSAGLLARFLHGPQAELLQAVELDGDCLFVEIAGRREPMPEPAVLGD
ncbi:MAG: hypothetical protein AB8G23_15110 [Myxococcota bacterium]